MRWVALISALLVFSGAFEWLTERLALREQFEHTYDAVSGALGEIRPESILGLYFGALMADDPHNAVEAPIVGHLGRCVAAQPGRRCRHLFLRLR
jgi:hypothetical protein